MEIHHGQERLDLWLLWQPQGSVCNYWVHTSKHGGQVGIKYEWGQGQTIKSLDEYRLNYKFFFYS